MGRVSSTTQKQQAEERRSEILRSWSDGQSITAIARNMELNRNAIRNVLESAGVRGAGGRSDARSRQRQERRDGVRRWVRENPGASTSEASDATGVPPRTVSDYLDGTPEQQLLVESRRKTVTFPVEDMLEHLRSVWEALPEDQRGTGLSKHRYERLAPEGSPSTALFEKRFPSWASACEAAGVPSARRTRRSYSREYGEDDMLDAIELCIAETGSTSFTNYSDWVKRHPGRPSGSLVITRFGRWGNARRAVIERASGAA